MTTKKSKTSSEPLVSRSELLLSDNGDTFRQFLNDLIWISKCIEMGRSEFASVMGLNPGQYSMIMLISQAQDQGGLSTGALSEMLHLHQPYVTLHLGKLMKKGLIDKRPNPDDRRSVLYTLTEKAKKEIKDISPVILDVNDIFFQSLSSSEMKALAKSFRKLTKDSDSAMAYAQGYARQQEIQR